MLQQSIVLQRMRERKKKKEKEKKNFLFQAIAPRIRCGRLQVSRTLIKCFGGTLYDCSKAVQLILNRPTKTNEERAR